MRRFIQSIVPLAALAFLAGCPADSNDPVDNFEEPVSVAVGTAIDIQNPQLGERPTAFVADQGNRAVGRIDLEGRAVRTRLPVGRLVGAIALRRDASNVVDRVYVVDSSTGNLLGLDPDAALSPTNGTPLLTDVGAASGLEMQSIVTTPGVTPTQIWTVEFDGVLGEWIVSGDGLGEQVNRAVTGKGYVSDEGEIRFTIAQTGAAPDDGDSFEVTTDNGVVEIDLGGARAVDIEPSDLSQHLLVTVTDPAGLVVVDMNTDTPSALPLPGSVLPAGIAFHQGDAFIADRGAALLHIVDPAAAPLFTVALPTRSRSVTVTPDGRRVFVLADQSSDVYVFDRDALTGVLTPLDIVGRSPGVDPVPFPGGVRALGSARLAHTMRTGPAAYPIVVTTFTGNARFLNGNSGCHDFADDRGATLDTFRFRDVGITSLPAFDLVQFGTSKCGGVTRTEEWTVAFNDILGGYEVSGSLSGLQTTIAPEDATYETDRGELRFRIEGNSEAPTTDGDTFTIVLDDGLATVRLGELPGEVAFFTIPDSDGNNVEFALVANPGNDLLSQIDVEARRVVASYR